MICALIGASTFAADRYHLGFYETGSTLTFQLDEPVPAAILSIELDGDPIRPIQISGRSITVAVPAGLTGRSHDLVVLRDDGATVDFLGTWEFELADQGGGVTYSLHGRAGALTDGQRLTYDASAGGRADFETPGGRLSGGVAFHWQKTPDPDTGKQFMLDSYNLQSRHVLFGDVLVLRLGTLGRKADSFLWDDSARRGVSATLSDLSGRYAGEIFASQTTIATGRQNLTGLADSDDRVIGAAARIGPLPDTGLTVTGYGYDGRAPSLPIAQTPGDVLGYGTTVTLPVGNADILARLDQTEYTENGTTRRGQSRYADAKLTLPLDTGRFTYTLGASYEWTDVDFFAPLNPDKIVGEETAAIELGVFDAEWDFALGGSLGRTNAGGPATAPVERLTELTADISYSPDVFTGGFLRGSTFYLGASMQRQDRLSTPAGAASAQDHTIWQLAAGVSRFAETSSFSVLYTHDVIDIRSTGGPADQTVQSLIGLTSFDFGNGTTVAANGTLRRTQSGSTDYWDAEAGGGFTYALMPNQLDFSLTAGGAWYENPTQEDYYFVDNALTWDFRNGLSLELSADYRAGQSTTRILPGDGWIFGLALRSEFTGAFQ